MTDIKRHQGDPAQPPENTNLAYTIRHAFKSGGGNEGLDIEMGGNERREIQVAAASALWGLKGHPHYFAYPNEKEQKLSDMLGTLPVDPTVIQGVVRNRYAASIDEFYKFSRTAQFENHGGYEGAAVKIPEMGDLVLRGILTDVVSATGRKILLEAMSKPHYQKQNEYWAERSGISVEMFREYCIANQNYYLFTMGYLSLIYQ